MPWRCTALEHLDDDHATAAAWTSRLTGIDGGSGGLAFRFCSAEQLTRACDAVSASVLGEQAVMADAVQAFWQHVGILDAIEDGMYQPAMKDSELEQQKAEIEKRLAEAPADVPDVHPNIAEHYRAKVIRLAETLAEPESNGEAREDIRSLIGEVVITPGEKRGECHATLRGELVAVLDLAAGARGLPGQKL